MCEKAAHPWGCPAGKAGRFFTPVSGGFRPGFFLAAPGRLFLYLGLGFRGGFRLGRGFGCRLFGGRAPDPLGVFFTHSRKNTEQPGKVSETLCSQPCMGTSWVLMALPLVTPPPPNSLASEVNTSAQVPRMARRYSSSPAGRAQSCTPPPAPGRPWPCGGRR